MNIHNKINIRTWSPEVTTPAYVPYRQYQGTGYYNSRMPRQIYIDTFLRPVYSNVIDNFPYRFVKELIEKP